MTDQTPLIDIRPDHWEIVRSILQKNVPNHVVWAFGSRATWKAKEYSDLDLAIITDRPLSLDVSASLSDDFSESDLPWRVDVVDWATTSEAFRKIIERDKVVVWEGREFGMGNEWSETYVGDLLLFSNGRASPERADGLPFPVYGSNGIIGYTNDTNAESGVIIIGRVGSYCGSLHRSTQKCWVTDNAIRAVAKDGHDPQFLFYLLGTLALNSRRAGSGQPLLNQDILSRIPTTVPKPAEQRAIAHILGTLDDKIELNRKQNETLEAMARALFKAWFVDFEPVRAKMEGHVGARFIAPNPDFIAPNPDDMGTDHSGTVHLGAVRSDAVHWGDIHLGAGHLGAINRAPTGWPKHILDLFPDRLVESELGEIPEGWDVSTLGTVCSYLNRGISPKYIDQGGVLVLNQKCIRDFSIDFSKARRHDVAQKKIDGRSLELGDVLINSTGVGTLGRVAQVCRLTEATIVDSHVTAIRSGSRINPIYLGGFMSLKQPEIETMGEGSTGQTELSRKKLGELKILLPPHDVLDQFSTHTKEFSERIAANQEASEALSQLRDTLLPKLISGELRIPDAEAFLRERGL